MADGPELSTQPPRLCRDCRHARPDAAAIMALFGGASRRAWRLARCMHPAARHPADYPTTGHLVTGEVEPPHSSEQFLCAIERSDNRPGHCGEVGVLWHHR